MQTRTEEPAIARERVSTLDLPAMATAVATARRHIHAVLAEWWIDKPLTDTIVLCGDEKVTNAIAHANPKAPDSTFLGLAGVQRVRLVIRQRPGVIRLEVFDPAGTVQPRCVAAEETDESGRGVLIVAELSTTWGSAPCRGGKVVWSDYVIDCYTDGYPVRTPPPPAPPGRGPAVMDWHARIAAGDACECNHLTVHPRSDICQGAAAQSLRQVHILAAPPGPCDLVVCPPCAEHLRAWQRYVAAEEPPAAERPGAGAFLSATPEPARAQAAATGTPTSPGLLPGGVPVAAGTADRFYSRPPAATGDPAYPGQVRTAEYRRLM